jgi:hypothetical protein
MDRTHAHFTNGIILIKYLLQGGEPLTRFVAASFNKEEGQLIYPDSTEGEHCLLGTAELTFFCK